MVKKDCGCGGKTNAQREAEVAANTAARASYLAKQGKPRQTLRTMKRSGVVPLRRTA